MSALCGLGAALTNHAIAPVSHIGEYFVLSEAVILNLFVAQVGIAMPIRSEYNSAYINWRSGEAQMFHLIVLAHKKKYNQYTLKRCLTQISKCTRISSEIGVICDNPIESIDPCGKNIHFILRSSLKNYGGSTALTRAFPYLQANSSVIVCESDLLILQHGFSILEGLCKGAGEYQGLTRYSELSEDLAGAAALRAPVMVKNSLDDRFWIGMGANITEMYGYKNYLELLIKKLNHRRQSPAAISAAGSDLPLEDWLFEDDDFLVNGHRGSKLQWADAFTDGLKSQAQYAFKKNHVKPVIITA